MKTSFGVEFASAAKEGPKLFFAPLVAAFRALVALLSRSDRGARSMDNATQSRCEGIASGKGNSN